MQTSLLWLIAALAGVGCAGSFAGGAFWGMRWMLTKGSRFLRDHDSKETSRAHADARASTLGDATGEIPTELVGAKGKETIERLASALGTTPVNLLRAALDIGLSGGRPITTEMLDMIDKLVEEGAEEDEEGPPSKPDPKDQN